MDDKRKPFLLPCPCCGAPAEFTTTCLIDSYSDHDIIACTNCRLMNDTANAEEWNRRVSQKEG